MTFDAFNSELVHLYECACIKYIYINVYVHVYICKHKPKKLPMQVLQENMVTLYNKTSFVNITALTMN